MERFLSAPGKVFISGEYSVLWGGTARVAAVGPRGQAYVRRREDAEVHLALEEGRLTGRATPLGVHWSAEVPEGFRFIARAVDEVLQARGKDTLGFTLAMSPTVSPVPGLKLGMGSSARAVVLAAEAARYVLEERQDALKLALVAHALAQHGKGSGGDVAASFAGGLIRYRRFDVDAVVAPGRPRSAALRASPPVDLVRIPLPPPSWLFAFTGASASTPKLIASAERQLDAAARNAFVQRSDDLGAQLEAGLVGGRFADVAEAVGGLQTLLTSLGTVETPEVRRLLALAQSYGCAGKVSGAGGGDGCIVFAPDAGTQVQLLEAYRGRGVHAFPLRLEAGLRGEVEGDVHLRTWAASD